MGENSKISWTDHTFNPWSGCAKVSPGCANCYAEGWAKRSGLVEWGPGQPRSRTSAANWAKVKAWDSKSRQLRQAGLADNDSGEYVLLSRSRVFCGSLCDWLDPEVPVEWLADLLALIHTTPNLNWLLLTKRPELWPERITMALHHMESTRVADCRRWVENWLMDHPSVPQNVWIGTSVEDQQRADERIPDLLKIPARVRFLSCEPLLGALEIFPPWNGPKPVNQPINWVIVGGESGPNRRPMDLAWMGGIIDQCEAAGVPVFVKQDNGARPGQQGRIPDEWWALKEFPGVGR